MKSTRIHRGMFGACSIAMLAAMAMAQPVHGAFIPLSTHATGNNDPTVLSALVEFSITGNNLTLTVTNQTSAPNAFHIREIFFNAAPELGSLTAANLPTGFSLQSNAHAGGFGWFDYGVIGSGASATIAPGASEIFSFTFTGSGVSEATFLSEFSTGPMPMIVAGKFVIGQNGPGGYGGANAIPIPTPGSAAMIALAILIGRPFGVRKRRALAAREV